MLGDVSLYFYYFGMIFNYTNYNLFKHIVNVYNMLIFFKIRNKKVTKKT